MGSEFSHELNPYVKPLAKQARLAAGYAGCMDASTSRTANFRDLVDKSTSQGRTKKQVAIEFDISPSFLSQLYGGKKIGDDVARKLEMVLRLPRGWMDLPPEHRHQGDSTHSIHGASPPQRETSQNERLSSKILASSVKVVRLACQALEIPFDPESTEDAAIVLLAYDYLSSRSETEVTADNVVSFTGHIRRVLQERGMDGNAQGSRSARTGAR
ncbi:hypothetical protein GCM10007235_17260 [Pseudoxanthomonas indica]|nr:hypothetical protein GCM10007235_17260 [Pseudoxanthomonas indica]